MTVTGRPAVLYPIIFTSFSGSWSVYEKKKKNLNITNRRLKVRDQPYHGLVRKLLVLAIAPPSGLR